MVEEHFGAMLAGTGSTGSTSSAGSTGYESTVQIFTGIKVPSSANVVPFEWPSLESGTPAS
jgi:hypothetical protein